jgi:hypothetical protein
MRFDPRPRRILPIAVVALGLLACSRRDGKPAPALAQDEAGSASEVVPPSDGGPRFSRPIAAVRVGDGSTIVAGLVVPSSSIVAARMGADGKAIWSKAVLDGVAWSGGSDLRALPAPGGAAIVWRGLRGGQNVTQMVRLGADGELRSAATSVGAAACATDDALAWLDHGTSGTTHVRVLTWGNPAPLDVLTMGADRDPELVCGAHRLFALGSGEDDVTVTAASALEAGAPTPILRDRDFPTDEEREHDAYTVGDALGIVRMGDSGALAMRELGLGPKADPWRTLGTHIAADDDIVAVDADAKTVSIVYTHEQGDACDGGPALAVRALRASRGEAAPETTLDVAAPACDRDPGPFWTGTIDRSLVVAWAERGHDRGPKSAPVSSLAYRVLDDPSRSSATRIELTAEDLVPAGCDKGHCYAVALVRPPGADGMQAEPVRVIAYP